MSLATQSAQSLPEGEPSWRERGSYEPYTAITFLLVGLGLGSVLALLLSPQRVAGSRL